MSHPHDPPIGPPIDRPVEPVATDLASSPLPPPADLLAPPRESWVRRFIVDYNPFFLLSALSMLAGSLALTNSMSWLPVRLSRILVLTATINLYELLLVAIGLFLILRRGGRRDGAILLVLEAFFLVDVAFLNAELFAIDRYVGLFANLVVFALAVVKLAVIFRVLGIDWRQPAVLFIGLELAALFALPGVLKFYATHQGGKLPPMAMFVAWWLVAGLLAAAVQVIRRPPAGILSWFVPLLSVLLSVSLVAHAGTGQWVYDLRYWGANLAPMLAVAAFALCRRPQGRPAGILLAIATVVASSSHDARLTFEWFSTPVSPIHVAAGVVYVMLAWTLARKRFPALMAAGVLMLMFALFGPAWATLRMWAEKAIAFVVRLADAIVPRTRQAWGIIGVVSSFVFLAIGTIISVRRSGDERSPRLDG